MARSAVLFVLSASASHLLPRMLKLGRWAPARGRPRAYAALLCAAALCLLALSGRGGPDQGRNKRHVSNGARPRNAVDAVDAPDDGDAWYASVPEAESHFDAAALFSAVDVSKDGFLTESELTWEMQKRTKKHLQSALKSNFKEFASLDRPPTQDGQVEWEEWHISFLMKNGILKDSQDLGRADRERLAAARAAWKEAARANPDKLNLDEFLSFAHPELSHPVIMQEAEDMIMGHDGDGDGKLTLDEFLAASASDALTQRLRRRTFATADLDGDGKLQKSEIFSSVLDPRSEAWCRERAGRLVAACDADGDAGVGREEMETCAGKTQWWMVMFPDRYFHPFGQF